MRKVLLFISALALATAPLTAANATTHYKITIGVAPDDIDVSPGHESAKVTIHGTVSGGPVSGKTVLLYRVNTSAPGYTPDTPLTAIGSAKLSSSGKYTKTDHPPRGGYWIYTAKKLGSGTSGAVKTHHLWAYQWDSFGAFYDNGSLNLPSADTDKVGHSTDKTIRTTGNGSDRGYYGDAYWVDAGGSLVLNSVGHRCKGITFHIGVANSPAVPSTVSYRYTVYKGSKAVFTHTMKQGEPVYEPSQTERKSFGEQVADGNLKITVSQVDGQPDARFVIGTPKIACTFPDDSIFE